MENSKNKIDERDELVKAIAKGELDAMLLSRNANEETETEETEEEETETEETEEVDTKTSIELPQRKGVKNSK